MPESDAGASVDRTRPVGDAPTGDDRVRPTGAVPLTVRYFAGARAAAGGVPVESAEAVSIDELSQLLTERHGERLGLVLKAASFLVDGLACRDRHAALPAGATVDVLPPFAGG